MKILISIFVLLLTNQLHAENNAFKSITSLSNTGYHFPAAADAFRNGLKLVFSHD